MSTYGYSITLKYCYCCCCCYGLLSAVNSELRSEKSNAVTPGKLELSTCTRKFNLVNSVPSMYTKASQVTLDAAALEFRKSVCASASRRSDHDTMTAVNVPVLFGSRGGKLIQRNKIYTENGHGVIRCCSVSQRSAFKIQNRRGKRVRSSDS